MDDISRLQGPKMKQPEEPSEELDRLAEKVIGAAIEVHRHLGPGFLEVVYEEALAIELKLRGIVFIRQPKVSVEYKGDRWVKARWTC